MPTLNPENTIVMETTKGRVVISLLPYAAPGHCGRIKRLVLDRFYDGLGFHRVIKGFMAQTGCPDHNGSGRSHYPDLRAEFNEEPHVRGACSMARSTAPHSANSQFFICLDEAGFLDGQYTVWGRVIEGMENLDMLKAGEPVCDPDKILSMRLMSEIRKVSELDDSGGSAPRRPVSARSRILRLFLYPFHRIRQRLAEQREELERAKIAEAEAHRRKQKAEHDRIANALRNAERKYGSTGTMTWRCSVSGAETVVRRDLRTMSPMQTDLAKYADALYDAELLGKTAWFTAIRMAAFDDGRGDAKFALSGLSSYDEMTWRHFAAIYEVAAIVGGDDFKERVKSNSFPHNLSLLEKAINTPAYKGADPATYLGDVIRMLANVARPKAEHRAAHHELYDSVRADMARKNYI